MLEVTTKEIDRSLLNDNPWWRVGRDFRQFFDWKRSFFGPFYSLLLLSEVHRAVVLMGPRRVGKTVLVQQAIEKLIIDGADPQYILYASLENPLYLGLRLDQILESLWRRLSEEERHTATQRLPNKGQYQFYVFFDEIQYLTDWEIHLKTLVDSFPGVKFAASGSAAAALKLKSRESGAGRFTDFLLPPLTFLEFLSFSNISDLDTIIESLVVNDDSSFSVELTMGQIKRLNTELVNYMNYGGFPEAINAKTIQEDPRQFIGRDIIDKVLLRDLPSLYGIRDTRDLNRFFAVLAYNSGNEVSMASLSKSSGIARNTIYKFLEYLEAAFLIQRVDKIDQNSRRLKKAHNFKIYLTNASLRAALFGPLTKEDPALGHMVETVVFSQQKHYWRDSMIYYARWKRGEVDYVTLDAATQKPDFAMEIKWSDRVETDDKEMSKLVWFCGKNDMQDAVFLSKTVAAERVIQGVKILIEPVSIYCALTGIINAGMLEHLSRERQLTLT